MLRFLVHGLVLTLALAAPVSAQDAKLVEAARKEGAKAVVYGSLESNTVEPILEAFYKKTGIVVEYWRASATKVMDRALSEHRAGKPAFDAMVNNSGAMHVMRKEGLFAKYLSPSSAAYSKEVIDADLGPAYRHTPIGIIFNKSQVKPGDAPKSLDDLFSPKNRGKVVMPDPTQHTTTMQWLGSLYKILGKENAEKFINNLAAAKPLMVESFAPSAERVSTGETPIAVSLVRYVITYGEKGAPVEYVRLGKMLSTGQYVTLYRQAPRPNSAKAFIDFFLGEESMRIMAKMGEFVNRKGIYPALPDADKIEAVEMDDFDEKGYAQKRQEYQKLFFKGGG